MPGFGFRMIWDVAFTSKAKHDLRRLPKAEAQRITDEVTSLANEPYPLHHVKKLKGHQSNPVYSLRVGEYRVILTIEDNLMIITVIEVGNRRTVYRKY
jgi:mRNA interferase RelE/StbE